MNPSAKASFAPSMVGTAEKSSSAAMPEARHILYRWPSNPKPVTSVAARASFLADKSQALGAYLSYFLNGATGGIIVCLQTTVFLLAFFLAPKHGRLAARRRTREAA